MGVFEKDGTNDSVLMHSETRRGIIALAKQNSVGSLRTAFAIYAEQAAADGDDELKHGIDALHLAGGSCLGGSSFLPPSA